MPRKLDSDSQIGRRLKLRDLHLFFTVVQYGSMAKAAVQLGISQPAVSEVIADLEHTLDARLFDRRPRGVEPTLYGKALLTRTRAVFDELRQGVNDIAILSDPAVGELRIGCPAAALATFLLQVIQEFSEPIQKWSCGSAKSRSPPIRGCVSGRTTSIWNGVCRHSPARMWEMM